MESAAEARDWYTVAEVAERFDKTPQAVRVAADRGRLPHDVVPRGKQKERRFPKNSIDNLDAWPGYGNVPVAGSVEDYLAAELERLRGENARLHRELTESAAGRAAAEMRIEELARTVERQRKALRALVEALGEDGIDLGQIWELLA